jgi:F-type H+-transporting ATPase subunit gamma
MRLADIEAHIASVNELLDIVGAMRSLASVRVQEAQRAVPGVRRYAESMARAIRDVTLLLPERREPHRGGSRDRVLILCTAEHGFVGGFNQRLLDTVASELGARDLFFVLGSRGALLARERGHRTAWTHAMATRLAGVPEVVDRLARQLYQAIATTNITRAEAVFARYRQGAAATIERRLLFPLDLESFAARTASLPPLHNLPPDALLEKLLAEYLFALLIEVAIESLASENAARFSAMDTAHQNVSKKLEQLQAESHRARQDEITTELIDLVIGTEALRPGSATMT